MKYKVVKMINVSDWNELVSETYGRPYNFQQQDGCKSRGIYHLTVPSDFDDDYMNETIPEVVNGDIMGVKFETWLSRDPTQLLPPPDDKDYCLELFWERNFYPDIDTVANDLYKRGLIEEGEYIINIDW